MSTATVTKQHYTLIEVARELGLPKHTITRLASAGRIKSRKTADFPTAPRLVSASEFIRLKRDGVGLSDKFVPKKFRK